MDDLGIFRPPPPDHFCEHPDHRWEAEKFEMDLDDIFTTLPRRFNMMVIPILDRDAFRLETSHIASITNNRMEFFNLLEVRLEARREELIGMMRRTFEALACDPNQMEESTHWGDAMHIYRSKSLDAFVRFFAGFLRSPRPSSATAVSASSRHDESSTPLSEPSSTSNSFNGVSCLSAEIPPMAPSNVPTPRESQTSANAAPTARKRKRSSITPVAGSLSVGKEDDEDAIRPAQKARLNEDVVEQGRMPSPPRRPSLRHIRRARESRLPVHQPPSPREVPPTTTITPTASSAPPRPQPAAQGANDDSSEQRGNVSSSQAANVGKGRQRVESFLAIPDTNNEEGDIEAGHRINTKKRASRLISAPTGRSALGTPSSMDQTRPLRRLSRRTRLGGQAFYELDHKSKARPVMAANPRKADGGRLLSTRRAKTGQARMVD